jgi:hypothetical protein
MFFVFVGEFSSILKGTIAEMGVDAWRSGDTNTPKLGGT